MKVSVVIPARNESAYIDQCLRAFSAQTLKPYEVIIVDNNSLDDTAQRARKYKHVQVVNEPVPGIAVARNAGFNHATGDIIARCDVDSLVGPGWVKEISDYFTAHPDVAGITGPAYFYDLPKLLTPVANLIFLRGYYLMSHLGTGKETLYGSNCALRRNLWQRISDEVCNDNNIHEDVDLGQHLSRIGKIAFDKALKVGVNSRSLSDPIGMLHRWRKGINNYTRHWNWR